MRLIKYIMIVSILCIYSFAQDCNTCVDVWWDNYWGEQCCDVAFEQWGFDCAYMENEYGWDCTGCNCPYDQDQVCGDGYCNGNESIDTCSIDCTLNGCNTSNQVDDCADDDCCPDSWIGDGYIDCEHPNNFGCDLSCYDNDGGDCFINSDIGDIDNNNQINIQDIIIIVDIILDNYEASDYQTWASDINNDEIIDIYDVISIIYLILID